ncbi:MAG: DUF2752 domain-containing protein [Verrucomicrobia bacterium]|nr:DUF2752 domain-containing protein [Verrucomicrobiota bacterium]
MTTGTPARRNWLPVAIVAGALAVLFFFNPSEHGFFPPCLFHELTGWNCPGCGATRAAHALLHGRLAEAWRDNALLVAALPRLAGFAVFRRRGRAAWVFRPAGLWILSGVLVVFMVVRNLPTGVWLSPP